MPASTMSRAAAIKAKCRDCIYDPYAKGTWREQVTACPSVNCPLWGFRPISHAIKSDADRYALVARLER